MLSDKGLNWYCHWPGLPECYSVRMASVKIGSKKMIRFSFDASYLPECEIVMYKYYKLSNR